MKGKQVIINNARNSVKPDYAKKICDSFGVTFNDTLIYTKLRYRETANEVPRVAVYELAEYICKELGLSPDNEKLEEADKYLGEGRRVEATTIGWSMNLPEGKEVKE